MRQQHRPGEKLFVDGAGDKISVHEPDSRADRGTNRAATRRLPTAFSTVSYITLIAWSYAVSPSAKQKLSAPNPKPTILLLPNRSSRNSDAGDKGAQTPPLSPAPQIPALPAKLCSNQLPNLLSNFRTSVSSASLRSETSRS